MFTRTSYCENCARNKQPQHDTLFTAWGTNSKKFIYRFSSVTKQQFGFTPHSFHMLKYDATTKIVTFQKFCGMNGCNVDIYRKKMKWELDIIKMVTGTMHIKDWEALQRKPDLGYHI